MKKLSTEEKEVILLKGTERPFSGKYYHFNEEGEYLCKQCGALLYRSCDKFDSGCGWPSFEDEIPNAVKRLPDADGTRTEIICAKCGAHLGHVFFNEGFTPKNVRHCVNSISLEFIPKNTLEKQDKNLTKKTEHLETAIFAGGCFWGVDYLMKQIPGVISVISGYVGGTMRNPTYQDVSDHLTGHAEAVQITFDSLQVSYETLAKYFFEIHDPEQLNKQGPDIGEQYRSEIFYTTPYQKEIALKLIQTLKNKGYQIVTKVTPATSFWKAEPEHQNYYERTGKKPYCHQRIKKF
ncbi:MAG: bifunctional methionine sulfoxide reductase B/A protein [Rickettsiella sp.]|nr:bifunctional methionine sulfoxide reductase B/A protein [Rickettsiella sp.]